MASMAFPLASRWANAALKKRKEPLSAYTGNRAGVNGADERTKIARVLGNEDKFTGDASLQHPMVGVSPTATIQGMLGKMLAARIQCSGYVGGIHQ